ncbi:MAG: hypothetical protein R6V50_00500 [Thermoplasmatota archaeon]
MINRFTMRFGVIICPRCKQVKGVELKRKTTTCPRCGKVLQLSNSIIYYKTDSQQKLQQAIGLINAGFDGRSDDFKKVISRL